MSRTFDVLQRREYILSQYPPAIRLQTQTKVGNLNRKGDSIADHEVLKLIQRVFILPAEAKTSKIVAFCGVERGAGSTWVCARASEMLASQVAGNVCLVDANFRFPSLHDYFQFENESGLANAINNTRPIHEFARRISDTHLSLITAGTTEDELKSSLNLARFRVRIAELRETFDFVLIDTPAVLSCGDAVLLGQLTDGIILVVGSNSTRREPARIAKESFESANVPILGAVLNRRTFPVPEVIYKNL